MIDMEIGRNGVKKTNLNDLKEIKVRVPVKLLLKLHFAKITESRLMGDLVTDALTQYFQGVPGDAHEADTAGSGTEDTSERREEASTPS